MTSVKALTLSEFLLARIAEDEAAASARQLVEAWKGPGARADSPFMDRWSPARVFAECTAKRRIVEADWRADDSGEADGIREDVLRLLALPHASHSDYSEAWRD